MIDDGPRRARVRNRGGAEMDIKDRNGRYLDLLKEVSEEHYYDYLRRLRAGKPDVGAALSIARNSDGLISGDQECERMVVDAVAYACLAAEYKRQEARSRSNARHNLEAYKTKRKAMKRLARKMKRLARKMSRDAGLFAAGHGGIEEHLRGHAQLKNAIRAIKITARLLKKFIKTQASLLRDQGGNFRPFDRAFVRAVRQVWWDITGKEAGIARKPVVMFAAELWVLFDFTPPNPNRPLFDWLAERFDNIR
ncbi:hypothetical protein GOE08_27155 [Sinorhizobium medicae]|nr:hypothetical protein [Sinorhizobium medicae]